MSDDDVPRALQGFDPGGDRLLALVLPGEQLTCRYHPARGFRWVCRGEAAGALAPGAQLDGVTLARAPLQPVLDELAHAVLAHRRSGEALPAELSLLAELLSPGGGLI
ncbi:MAG: hypothetical protein EOO75_07275 [Myxococcales bacterium]|nr:MAG: hypothetical protein EOO75_07275 [Myxococcales bacterium]